MVGMEQQAQNGLDLSFLFPSLSQSVGAYYVNGSGSCTLHSP